MSGPIRRRAPITFDYSQVHESVIGEYLLNIVTYNTNYSEEFFSVLHKARTKHHINILKAAVINNQRLALFRQRELKHKLAHVGEFLIHSD